MPPDLTLESDGPIDVAAHAAATSPNNDLANPTPAQLERGNYRKGHATISGFDVTIENPEGSERRGVAPDGKPWSVTLQAHYGYIKRSTGADGDHVDVFIRPEIAPDYDGPVWIVDQLDAYGFFDEHKVMLGWPDKDSARDAYFANYAEGWPKKRVRDIYAMTLQDFQWWLKAGPPPTLAEPTVSDSYEVFATDAQADGLCRVRVRTTLVDAVNGNNRIYRRATANAAADALNARAKAGAVLCEIEHPVIVNVCDRGSCGQRFVDGGPDAKVARLDGLTAADADGWIYGEYTVLDTPPGRALHQSIQDGKPLGVSTRMKLSKDTVRVVNGRTVHVPDQIRFLAVDFVEKPAVAGAGEYTLLTDCELESLAADSEPPAPEISENNELGEPFTGTSNNTANPSLNRKADTDIEEIANGDHSDDTRRSAQELEDHMDKKILALLRTFRTEVTTGACSDNVNAASKAACDAILEAYKGGEKITPEAKELLELAHTDAVERIAGYTSGREGPYGVLANVLGSDPTSGWSTSEMAKGTQGVAAGTTTSPNMTSMATADTKPEPTEEEKENSLFLAGLRKRQAEEAALQARTDSIEEALKPLLDDETHPLNKMATDQKENILGTVRKVAPAAGDVVVLVDSLIASVSQASATAIAASRGLGGVASGQTVADSSNPLHRASVTAQPIPMMADVEKMELAYDEMMRNDPVKADQFGWVDSVGGSPTAAAEKSRRERNRLTIMPIAEQQFALLARNMNLSADSLGAADSVLRDVEGILASDTVAYNTVVSSMYNQPTIALWMLIQAFQDQRFAEFCGVIGPGQQATEGMQGWETQQGVGRVLRVPSETYTEPSGFNGTLGMPFDLNVAENSGIAPGTPNIYWDTFAPLWRKIAHTASIESINAIGRGPLNYAAIVRGLWHMAARKCRAIDSLLGNEIYAASLETGAVAVASEAYTTGGSNGLDLASNSVAVASGALSVNLNPQKKASDAIVASTDKSVVYGTGNSTGGAAVLAALRLKAGGGGGVDAVKGTYCSLNQAGPTPIVPPRTIVGIDGKGADSSSTTNPLTVTVPGAQVLGYLGPDGNIYSSPGTTATFAVDYMNGLIVFIAGQVTRSGSVFTTATTVAPYSYATNFDYFVLNEASLATGETIQQYYSRLLGQIDISAAAMGASKNFVKPDLGLCSLTVAAKIIQAALFYKLNSPDGTELFPDETYFARRNGVNLARTNAPGWLGDNGIVLLRKGTTRYAMDTPFEVKGPIFFGDTTGNPIAGEAYYGAENSVICTPQVKDQTGAVKNAVSRMLALY